MISDVKPDEALRGGGGGQHSCVASSSRDLSREGPFAVSETLSDTGILPLVTNML